MRRLSRNTIFIFLFIAGVAVLPVQSAAAQSETNNVSQKALKILDRATSFLAAQDQFSARVEIWEDFAVAEDLNVQFAQTVEFNLRRPDHFRIQVATTQPEKTVYYNGRSVTYIDHSSGFFGIAPAPPTIDKTIAKMEEVYDLTFPLDDILLSTPFGGSAKKAKSGQYHGIALVSGIACHHLAFQHDRIDWQVWVEEGLLPVVRKLVITHKTEQGSPQFTAMFDSWDFQSKLSDYLFIFEPSTDFLEVDMLVTDQDKTPIQK